MKTQFSNLILAALMCLPLISEAQRVGGRSLDLNMNHQEFTQSSTIPLKRLLQQQYPRVDVSRLDLEGVTLHAKSRAGRGEAELMVNGRSQDRQGINGRPRDFDSNGLWTYDRVELQNWARNDFGAWQIALTGNIKVHMVTVHLARESGPGGPGNGGRMRYVDIDEETADKFVAGTRTFILNQQDIQEIVLEGTNRSVDIQQVVIEYAGNRQYQVPQLMGTLRHGQQVRALVDGRNIRSVTITSISPESFSSKGRYKVSVGIQDQAGPRPPVRPPRR